MNSVAQNVGGIGGVIDTRPMSGLQIRTVLLCGLAVLLDGYDIQTMALAVPALAAEWGLERSAFGAVLAAAIVGIGVGSALLAPLADRFGRRPVLIASLFGVGLASLATAFSGSLAELVGWRFVTGLALGTSLPSAAALTSEFVPARRRASLVTLMFCNVALGAFIAGFTAPLVMDAFGWRGIFVVGGVLPVLLSAVLFVMLPESLRFLLARRPGDRRIDTLLGRLAPGVDGAALAPVPDEAAPRPSVAALFLPVYRARTLLLWTVFCLNLFVLYLLISWLPSLLRDAGWPPARALQGAVMIQAGGIVGGLAIAALVDRGRSVAALFGAYCAAAAALALLRILPADPLPWGMLLVVLGAGVSGSQLALYALAAAFYPPTIRATGLGWSAAVGRIGAMLGPLAGGWILALQLPTANVLGLLAVPVVACAALVVLLPLVYRPPAR